MTGLCLKPFELIILISFMTVRTNMQIYAGSFFAIPLVRWFSIKRKNNQIENRNKARLQFARALESPDIALRRKVGTSVVT